MSLVQRNDLVEQFAAAASYPTFRDAVLPGTLNRGLYIRDSLNTSPNDHLTGALAFAAALQITPPLVDECLPKLRQLDA